MNFNNAYFEMAAGTAAQLSPSDLPEVAFSGRSNVGKSTLLNAVLGRKAIARVSSTPGKTTTVNFFRVGEVRLCDLPGYGYAKVAGSERQRWAGMMEHYFSSGRDIRLVIQLIDMRHPPTGDDRDMLAFLQQQGIPVQIVLTKSDKLNKTAREQRLAALKDELAFLNEVAPPIPFSALKREGIGETQTAIEAALIQQEI